MTNNFIHSLKRQLEEFVNCCILWHTRTDAAFMIEKARRSTWFLISYILAFMNTMARQASLSVR